MANQDKENVIARRARTNAYAEKVRKLFEATVNEILALNRSIPKLNEGEMFSFELMHTAQKKKVEELLRRLHSLTKMAIEQGIELEWNTANKECDTLVKSLFGKGKKLPTNIGAWMQNNNKALNSFVARSEKGLNLSNRVWQSVKQLRDEMEVAMTVAIGEGESASQMSRKVRQYLNDPDLMFRRFRYKNANGEWKLKWKKKVKDDDGRVHWIDYDKDSYQDEYTGRGYYKSAAKNAIRVTRTETNIAYRTADHTRWQQLDFILGVKIQLSQKHPEKDICDTLAGDYPKDFKFTGWHPMCYCFATPIVASFEEQKKMLAARKSGKSYISPNQITKYPDKFKNWIEANKSNILNARENGTEPYFLRDNATIVDNILFPKQEPLEPKENDDTLMIDAKIKQAISPRKQKAFITFEPFSTAIIETMHKLADKREKNKLFDEILNDNRAEIINVSEKAKTTYFQGNKGKKSNTWEQTKQMTIDLNNKGKSVCFLPELESAKSADAIVQFKNKWVIADFKHTKSTNYNTIAKELERGFHQANTIVLKIENGDLGTFQDVINQLKRKDGHIGNIILINEYGKVKELESTKLKNNKYLKEIRGFL